MRLRKLRDERAAWQSEFFERSRLFDAFSPLAQRLASRKDWPTPDELTTLVGDEAKRRGVWAPTFVSQPPKKRGARDRASLYDVRIVEHGEVPTRERHWHDVMNALAWLAFPQCKRALHQRQYEIIAASVGESFDALPGARSKEHDAIAMLDEGGALVLCTDAARDDIEHSLKVSDRSRLEAHLRARDAYLFVLGHGILESVVLANELTPVHAFVEVFSSQNVPHDVASARALVDALAADAVAARRVPTLRSKHADERPPRGLLLDEDLFVCMPAKSP